MMESPFGVYNALGIIGTEFFALLGIIVLTILCIVGVVVIAKEFM